MQNLLSKRNRLYNTGLQALCNMYEMWGINPAMPNMQEGDLTYNQNSHLIIFMNFLLVLYFTKLLSSFQIQHKSIPKRILKSSLAPKLLSFNFNLQSGFLFENKGRVFQASEIVFTSIPGSPIKNSLFSKAGSKVDVNLEDQANMAIFKCYRFSI